MPDPSLLHKQLGRSGRAPQHIPAVSSKSDFPKRLFLGNLVFMFPYAIPQWSALIIQSTASTKYSRKISEFYFSLKSLGIF